MSSAVSTSQPSVTSLIKKESEARMNEKGAKELIAGQHVSLRMWEASDTSDKISDPSLSRGYVQSHESCSYCIEGEAEMELEGQRLIIKPGESWLVPANASHSYRVTKAPFKSIEFCGPPEGAFSPSSHATSGVSSSSAGGAYIPPQGSNALNLR